MKCTYGITTPRVILADKTVIAPKIVTYREEVKVQGNGIYYCQSVEDIISSLMTDEQIRWTVNEFCENDKSPYTCDDGEPRLHSARKLFDWCLASGGSKAPAIKTDQVDFSINYLAVGTKMPSPKGKFLKKLVDKNPRKEATHGFHSMGILINYDEPVSYETYLAEGGRPQDLRHDWNKGHVEIVNG